MKTQTKGFTLIELLVVIAIVAILAVVVILTLNPAELLRQARDSNRVSDLSTLNSALALYLTDVSTVVLSTNYANCNTSASTSTVGANCDFAGTYTITVSSSQAVDSTGWVPVNLTSISSGAPIANLPVDPTNSGQLVYRYVATSSPSLAYELNAQLESTKYTDSNTGLEANDGGSSTTIYEIGTDSGLDL